MPSINWSRTGKFLPLGLANRLLVKLEIKSPVILSKAAKKPIQTGKPKSRANKDPDARALIKPRHVLFGPSRGLPSLNVFPKSSGLDSLSSRKKASRGGVKFTSHRNESILTSRKIVGIKEHSPFQAAGCALVVVKDPG